MNPVFLKKLLEFYLLEDSFHSDITTESTMNNSKAKASIKAKEDFVIAGTIFIEPVLSLFDENFKANIRVNDGQYIKKGATVATIEARVKTLLTSERLILNILQRLSGIATKTKELVDLVKPFNVKITDTRKTTPGFRFFEKYAVRVGGGINHRMGLFDAVLIKDNHIKAAGSLKKAIEMAKKHASFTTKIEVECSNYSMVRNAVEAGVDIIMLDNMETEQIQKVINDFKGKVIFEASGNIDENNIVEVAKAGVDFISLGALTHHACWVDINMKLE